MTIAADAVRAETVTTQAVEAPAVTWTLVHAAPGALVFAAPGVAPSHPLARGARSEGRWVPSGSIEVPAGTDEPASAHHARFIGRVGLLAAALGVGAALVGRPGVALAEPTDTDTGASSTSTSETGTDTGTQDSTTEPSSAQTTDTTVSTSGEAETSRGAEEAETPSDSVSSPETSGDTAAPAEQAQTEAPESSTGLPQPATDTEAAEPVQESVVEQTAPPADVPAAPVEAAPVESTTAPTENPPTPGRSDTSAATAPTAATPKTAPTETPSMLQVAPTLEEATPLAPTVVETEAPAAQTVATTSTDTPTEGQITEPAAPLAGVSQMLSTVLAPAAGPAAQAAQTSMLWGVLAWVQRTFFNQSPTVTYNPADTTRVDDTITGHLVTTDTDSTTLTYTVVANPEHGTVSIASDGQFTYTVTDHDYVDNGGLDSFTVTVTDADNDIHLHGLGGLLNLISFGLIGDPAHSATLTVTPVNAAPIVGDPAYTVGTPDDEGALQGALHVTDPDHDSLKYTVTGGPADGAVILHADGTFTYTPTAEARHDAAAEQHPLVSDNFVVTVDDTHHHTVTVPVAVTIDPANTAPQMTLEVSDPATDGTVHVSVLTTDADTDPITYLVVHDPASGTVAATVDGFTYTPSAAARDAAAATPGIDTDTFTVRASDAHHGVDTETATVVIAPDIPENTVTATVGVGSKPTQVTISPDGTRAYVTNTHSNSVSVIDTATNTVVDTVHVGWRPTQVTVSPDGAHAYVTNAASNTVSVIDTTTNTVTKTVHVGWRPTQVTVSPDGAHAYVTNAASNTVSVIDTTTNTVTKTVHVGWRPTQVTVSPDGTHVYVTNTFSRSVSVIDTATNTVVDTVHVGWRPTQVAVSPDGTHVYVTNTFSRSVSVIDTATNTVVDTVHVGSRPIAVAVSSDGTRVYVTNAGSNTVSVIDTTTNTVVDTVHVGNGPIAVAVGAVAGGSGPVVTPPSEPSDPDPTTGAVTGSLGVVDPDGDPLTITLTSAPAYGTVTFDDITGTYTYAPNQAGRLRAGLGLATDDSFTVTITQPGTGTAAQPVIYVANVNSNTVSVIGAPPAPAARALTFAAVPAALSEEDGFSQQVTINGLQITPDQFVVSDDPITVPWGVGLAPMVLTPTTPTRGYLAINRDQTVQVIDVDPSSDTYNTVIDTIAVGRRPWVLAVNPDDATQLYAITLIVPTAADANVSVIDTSTKEVTVIPVTINYPGWLAMAKTPNGTRAYVSDQSGNTVSVIDTSTKTVIDTIPVGEGPAGLAVSPDGTRVYVGNGTDGTMSVIDTADNNVIATIPIGNGPLFVTVSPDGSRVYLHSWTEGTISVINTADNAVVGDPIPIGSHPIGSAVSPDGSLVYVSISDEGIVSVIDTYSHAVLTTIAVGDYPIGVTVTPDGNHIYVVCDNYHDYGTVEVISIVPANTPSP